MNIMDTILTADPRHEVISTEDMISNIDTLNEDIISGKVDPSKLQAGSLDV